ncbi:MAG TPA: mandelate racemase/muconate lactonizing enzyme family protein [Spirochaetia bacterium]|nr:mandelate racemase/muconate lactonizing enzyme family protein [Spirochaetia bacterium]
MKITEILVDTVSIGSEIQNAFINFSEMTVSIVAVVSDIVRNGKPLTGFGFNSNGRYAQGGIISERMIPRLLKANPEGLKTADGENLDPFKAWQVMMKNEKPGGHGDRSVAVGVIDMALWDLTSKIEEKPLYQLLADRFREGISDNRVPVYAAGGYYYPDRDAHNLKEEIRRYLESGYTDVKIKIGGATQAEDRKRIESVLGVLGSENTLAVDANGRFDYPTALDYLMFLEEYSLRWFEEPCDPLDFQSLAGIGAAARMPIATGENLFSHQETRNLLRYGGLKPERDYLQMDPALSYGLPEFIQSLEILRGLGWSARRCIPHGGHQFALHIAAGLGLGGNESYPGVFQPFGGFADDVTVSGGYVTIPDSPGIGIELKKELYRKFKNLIRNHS